MFEILYISILVMLNDFTYVYTFDQLKLYAKYPTFSNPKGIVTGAYEDSSDRDERYWAAAQLFKATGNEKYNKKIKDYVSEKIEMDYGWQTVGNYGNQAYLKAKGADESTCNKIKKAMIKEADKIVEASKEDSYGVANGAEYYWGSNMGILDQASLLEFVNKLSANPEYDEYAKEHINYCFGKNANAISFAIRFLTEVTAFFNPLMSSRVSRSLITS